MPRIGAKSPHFRRLSRVASGGLARPPCLLRMEIKSLSVTPRQPFMVCASRPRLSGMSICDGCAPSHIGTGQSEGDYPRATRWCGGCYLNAKLSGRAASAARFHDSVSHFAVDGVSDKERNGIGSHPGEQRASATHSSG